MEAAGHRETELRVSATTQQCALLLLNRRGVLRPHREKQIGAVHSAASRALHFVERQHTGRGLPARSNGRCYGARTLRCGRSRKGLRAAARIVCLCFPARSCRRLIDWLSSKPLAANRASRPQVISHRSSRQRRRATMRWRRLRFASRLRLRPRDLGQRRRARLSRHGENCNGRHRQWTRQ